MSKSNEKLGEKLSPEQKIMSKSKEISHESPSENNKPEEVHKDIPEPGMSFIFMNLGILSDEYIFEILSFGKVFS